MAMRTSLFSSGFASKREPAEDTVFNYLSFKAVDSF